MADILYSEYGLLPEGAMTRLRATLVRKEALAEVGELLGVSALIRTGASTPVTPSILADVVEAVIGAVFLDAGYPTTRTVVLRAFQPLIERLRGVPIAKDPKTELQELLQKKGQALPTYSVREDGPAHQRSFHAECVLPARNLRTTGHGTSRKAAEQQAAQAMLEQLGQ